MPKKLKIADLEKTGPGTPAGRYLRLFWQPVLRGKDLPAGRTKPVQVLGERFTAYRGDDGRARITAFRCPHRGAQLSLGWVEGDAIRCRYHGWKFSGTGQCVAQPIGEKRFAQSVSLPVYPAIEYLGLVFAYFGEGEPPAFPRYPDFEREGAIVTEPVEVIPCNFWNRLENDIAHFPWTHRATILRKGLQELLSLRREAVEEAPYGYVSTSPAADEETSFRNTAHFFMPNVYQLWIRTRAKGFEGSDLGDTKITWAVPVNDRTVAAYDVTYTPLQGQEARDYVASRLEQMEGEANTRTDLADKILAGDMTIEDLPSDMGAYTSFAIEDYVTQVGQGPVVGRTPERLGLSDARVILLRRLWLREVGAMIEGRAMTRWELPDQPVHAEALASAA